MDANIFKGLSPKKIQTISLLCQGESQAEISKIVGVAESTLCRWKADPEFETALKKAQRASREEGFAAATSLLANAVPQAVMKAYELMEGKSSPSIQLRAAQLLLDYGFRVHQGDLAADIEELKGMVAQLMGDPSLQKALGEVSDGY
ncbi:helix-turn-helix domain-containing protein [Oculatella sp. LEGE 06141]|uniref:helix-turn-helix domain-containing protein n=1 Tax=Oculatella sp. LEGE 06141 TaxID=1828648 RepID=UPI00187E6E0C|nr:helix-turn-helix domain-containing protein [Oculatella sp. LEGE 06141]MBE9182416.1 helix-turn-helix domain-containing protein [Oculatella sp. LEGE 06141]